MPAIVGPEWMGHAQAEASGNFLHQIDRPLGRGCKMPAVNEMLFPETVMAMAVLDASAVGKGLRIEDISKLFVDLEGTDARVRDVALRSVPDGFYSEDVESFIGRFLAAGYAKARSPIKFYNSGLGVCRDMVRKALRENGSEVKKVAAVLRYDLDTLIGQEPR